MTAAPARRRRIGGGGLPPAELAALLGQARGGDVEARRSLALANHALVVRLAERLGGGDAGDQNMDDRIQAGYLGLMRAIDEYDEGGGAAFSNVATVWIMKHILIEIAGYNRLVHVSNSDYYEAARADRVRDALRGELGRSPDHTEVAAAMDVPESWVRRFDRISAGQRAVAGGAFDLACATAKDDPAEAAAEADDRRQVRDLLNRPPEREREVLFLRHGLGWELKDIARQVGVSRERVRQIEMCARQRFLFHAGAVPEPPRGGCGGSTMPSRRQEYMLDRVKALELRVQDQAEEIGRLKRERRERDLQLMTKAAELAATSSDPEVVERASFGRALSRLKQQYPGRRLVEVAPDGPEGDVVEGLRQSVHRMTSKVWALVREAARLRTTPAARAADLVETFGAFADCAAVGVAMASAEGENGMVDG
jgi:RNA polymerase sigma factor (sigma-70 family)